MKTLKSALTMVGALVLSAGQGSLGQPEPREARQELEVMKSILETTARMVLEKEPAGDEPFELMMARGWPGRSSIGGFYLHGQGAVFLIQVPRGFEPFPRELNALERQLRALERAREVSEDSLRRMEDRLRAYREFEEQHRFASEAYEEAVLAAELAGAPQSPPEPPSEPQPAVRPAPPKPEEEGRKVRDSELKSRVDALEQRLAERKANFEESQKEYTKNMELLCQALLEAVARHGSALTMVKSGEYINLILTSNGFGLPISGSGMGKSTVLSIPKQAVEDFRSGKASLENFIQRVAEYEI